MNTITILTSSDYKLIGEDLLFMTAAIILVSGLLILIKKKIIIYFQLIPKVLTVMLSVDNINELIAMTTKNTTYLYTDSEMEKQLLRKYTKIARYFFFSISPTNILIIIFVIHRRTYYFTNFSFIGAFVILHLPYFLSFVSDIRYLPVYLKILGIR